jgi:prepilin-type processing-associated H-X9-DG protein
LAGTYSQNDRIINSGGSLHEEVKRFSDVLDPSKRSLYPEPTASHVANFGQWFRMFTNSHVGFVHQANANAWFMDGHVEALSADQVILPPPINATQKDTPFPW